MAGALNGRKPIPVILMPQPQEISVCFSYAHEDEQLRDELAKHLRILEREGVIG